jgi:hypothetical protein
MNIGQCRGCGLTLRSPATSVQCPKGCRGSVLLRPVKFVRKSKLTKCGAACERATTRHCDCVCGGKNHGRKGGYYIYGAATKSVRHADAEQEESTLEAPPDPFELSTHTFTIALNKQATLVADLERLAKRAKRLHAPPITWAFGAVTHRKIKRTSESGKTIELEVPFIEMTLTGARPRIAGWEFIATLQHLEGNVNMLRKCPGAYERTIPAKFRTRGPTCDHCQQDRQRKDTYVLVNQAGTWKQVGSSCLVDFLGHKSPHEIAAYAELLAAAMELSESAEDEEGSFGGGGGGRERAYSLVTFLTYVAAEIRESGWVPKSAHDAEGGKTATVYGALDRLDPMSPVSPRDRSVLPIDKALAEAAVDWAQGLEASGEAQKNDYLWNVYAAAKSGTVSYRTTGIAASIVAAYARMETKRREPKAPSVHVGAVGETGVWKLTLVRHSSFDSEYGTLHIYSMRDEAGNIFVWKTGTGGEMTQGETYLVAGTVKKHDDYKGTKQTVLTRCAIHAWDTDKYQTMSQEFRLKALKERAKKGAATADEQTELESMKIAQKDARKLLPKGPPKPPPEMKYYVKSQWTYLMPSEDQLRGILQAGGMGASYPWAQIHAPSTGYKHPKPSKMTAIFNMESWTPEHYQRTLGELDSLPTKKATAAHFSLALGSQSTAAEHGDVEMPQRVLFTAVVLDEASREKLLGWWVKHTGVPLHGRIFAHHMTIKFKPTPEEIVAGPVIGSGVALKVTGWAADERGQAVLVNPGGVVSTNAHPHISISTAPGTSPVYSNELLARGCHHVDGPMLLGVVEAKT